MIVIENRRLFAIFFVLGVLVTIIVFIPFNAIPFINISSFEKGAPRIYLYGYHIHHFWFGIPMLIFAFSFRKMSVFKKLFGKYELHVFYFSLGVATFTLCSQIPEIILAGGNLFF